MMSDVIFSQHVKKHVPLAFSNTSPPLLRVSRKLRASFTRAIYSGAADMFNLERLAPYMSWPLADASPQADNLEFKAYAFEVKNISVPDASRPAMTATRRTRTSIGDTP